MRKLLKVIGAGLSVFAVAGTASAVPLLTNGGFDNGLNGWIRSGDVQLGTPGLVSNIQGMTGSYALLGFNYGSGNSTLSQTFNDAGYQSLTIAFDWAFDYIDLSSKKYDEFMAIYAQANAASVAKVTLMDLVSGQKWNLNGTSMFGVDAYTASGLGAGFAWGHYEKTYLLAPDASGGSLTFSLIESALLTASAAGIDNVSVDATAAAAATASPVPEPGTMMLLGSGLLGLGGVIRRTSKRG